MESANRTPALARALAATDPSTSFGCAGLGYDRKVTRRPGDRIQQGLQAFCNGSLGWIGRMQGPQAFRRPPVAQQA